MNFKPRALLGASALLLWGLTAALLPTTASATATLKVIKGSGEFQSLETSIAVQSPQNLIFEWTHNQAGATSARWVVTDVSSAGIAGGGGGMYGLTTAYPVAASGQSAPAPQAGVKGYFTIPANAFLESPSTPTTLTFNVKVTPYSAANVAMGSASPAVVAQQVPPAPGTEFAGNANYPKVEIVSYEEKVGVVPGTQIYYTGADVTVRVQNKSLSVTDPAWMSIKDRHGLLRQNTSKVYIPSLPRLGTQSVRCILTRSCHCRGRNLGKSNSSWTGRTCTRNAVASS